MSQGQSAPRRDLETLHTFQRPCRLHCSTQVGCVCATLQLTDEQLCNGSVTLVDHVETVGPTGSESALAGSRGAHIRPTLKADWRSRGTITRFWRDLENLA